jgi:hypothetical protein
MTKRFLSLIIFLSWLAGGCLLRAESTNTALAKAVVLESNVAYLRIGDVTKNLPGEIQSTQAALAAGNKIAGTVLDLRFADGDDLAAATITAGLFAAKKLPLVILVNGKTRGAAAALVTVLRETRDGLVLGSATADLKPDIAVSVNIADEKQYLKNPYAALEQSETNAANTNHYGAFIDHTTEADLVREKIKDGEQDEDSEPPKPTEPQKPYIHDPVLARAVDLIKALAVVRQSHG